MQSSNRVFIFGAGFSKPAGMPLANDILPRLLEALHHEEMNEWLRGMRDRLNWLSGSETIDESLKLNIEQVFHLAHFDVETWRLRQHLSPVGRSDGPDTPWNCAEAISGWLGHLEEALRDLLLKYDSEANLKPIERWATYVQDNDTVITFNYDTLVERTLDNFGRKWNHGTRIDEVGMPVFKLHGSIDWIVADRLNPSQKLVPLFEKNNANRTKGRTGDIEDDCLLYRCRSRAQLSDWIAGRGLQISAAGEWPTSVGIAGLGAYKELHQIPGLGEIWVRAMQTLHKADTAVFVGFSLSDFDMMAQLQFAEVARARFKESRPWRVLVIDPFMDDAGKERFRRVFRSVEFIEAHHEDFDWQALN